MTADQSVDRSSEILEYCRLKDIAIQAWSPFQYGFFEGVYLDNAKFGPLNDTLDAIGRKYGCLFYTSYMPFLLADGSIRPHHEAVLRYTKPERRS